jgi:hypothetical protein
MVSEPSIATAAALALYVTWREVVPRLANGKANGRAGQQSVDFWKLEFRQAQQESMERVLVPKFDHQIAIFEEIRGHMQKTNEALAVLLAKKR